MFKKLLIANRSGTLAIRLSAIAISIIALSVCQKSTAQNVGNTVQSVAQVGSKVSHSDCDAMPWNSAKTNCEASYVAEAAGAAVEREYKLLIPIMDAKDREWANQKKFLTPDPDQPTYRDALAQSQKTWLAFRDAQCQIEMYEWRGGASEPQRGDQCVTVMNRKRLAQLREMQKEF